MSMSNPLRPWWRIGVTGGIPLLALALGAGDAGARSVERDTGSGAGQKSTAARTASQETRRAAPAQARPVGTRNHDPCCADEPPVPRAREGTSDAPEAPATLRPQLGSRGTSPAASPGPSEVRPTGVRSVKRAGDGRLPPRSKQGEQRRGGAGALFGITFA